MTWNIHMTAGLAQWICSASHDWLPATVREKTVDVIYDAVGAMAACSILPEVKASVELIELQGAGRSAPLSATGRLDFCKLHDPADAVDTVIASMQPRLTFVGRDDWTGMEQGRHAIVIIRTREGRTFEEEVWHQPMTRAELEHKFRALVGPTFGVARMAKLHRLLSGVETAASIRPLMQELHG